MIRTRSGFVAVAFAATVGAALTGLSISGETRESSLEEMCKFSAWPNIPAVCLDGQTRNRVREIPIVSPERLTMDQRFAAAFDGGFGG